MRARGSFPELGWGLFVAAILGAACGTEPARAPGKKPASGAGGGGGAGIGRAGSRGVEAGESGEGDSGGASGGSGRTGRPANGGRGTRGGLGDGAGRTGGGGAGRTSGGASAVVAAGSGEGGDGAESGGAEQSGGATGGDDGGQGGAPDAAGAGGQAGMFVGAAGRGGGAGMGAAGGSAGNDSGERACWDARTGPNIGAATECIDAEDCDHRLGPRGCGAWVCSAGSCQAEFQCNDGDGDGLGVGPDCACTCRLLDCDDGDASVGDTASAACCNGGTRACKAGQWALCSGASGESCNGADDDCNGAVDDLGVFTCGLGACKKTVPACEGGVLGVCVPDAPATDVDACNGIDDDCDGAVDEDCPVCLHVAPDGDDAAAGASHGVTPFASVQAALDFADAHREAANRVCVASGPTCGNTATFPGPPGADLVMRDGVSLLGGYESTGWTRCTDSVTHLAPQTSVGVLFPPTIAVQTALDGFTVDWAVGPADSAAAITVDGARGAVVSNLIVPSGPTYPEPPAAYDSGDAVRVIHGASATVMRSRLDGGRSNYPHAVHAVGAKVVVEDNCPGPMDALTGRCTTSYNDVGGGPGLLGRCAQRGSAVLLEGAVGSRVENSALLGCTTPGTIAVTGAAAGVVVRGNRIDGVSMTYPGRVVSFEECSGGAPWLVDNDAITQSTVGGTLDLIYAGGDCHPVLEANAFVGTSIDRQSYFMVTGARCAAAGSVPSRCVIAGNTILAVREGNVAYQSGAGNSGTGVACDSGSCARIERNQITGLQTALTCSSGACVRNGNGVILSGGSPYVGYNSITAGSASSLPPGSQARFTFVDLAGVTGGVVEHNRAGYVSGSAAVFEWNSVSSVLWQGGGTLNHNCLTWFDEQGTSADPLVFTNNVLSSSYKDEGNVFLTTADQINALTDMTSSGNTMVAFDPYGPPAGCTEP